MQLRAQLRGEQLADAVDQERHLVADQADVAARGGEHGKARAVADAHQQHDPAIHLDNCLNDATRVEATRRALGEADQAGRDRGELIGAVAGQPVGAGQEQAVGRHHDRVRDTGHALREVGDKPAEPARLGLGGGHEDSSS